MLPSLYVEGTHADFSGQQTVAQISQSLVKSSVMNTPGRHKEMGFQKNTQHSVCATKNVSLQMQSDCL